MQNAAGTAQHTGVLNIVNAECNPDGLQCGDISPEGRLVVLSIIVSYY